MQSPDIHRVQDDRTPHSPTAVRTAFTVMAVRFYHISGGIKPAVGYLFYIYIAFHINLLLCYTVFFKQKIREMSESSRLFPRFPSFISFISVNHYIRSDSGLCHLQESSHISSSPTLCNPVQFVFRFCCIAVTCSDITGTAWFNLIRDLFYRRLSQMP